MAITYPGAVDAFPPIGTEVNTNDTVGSRTHRDMHNDLGDAVVAIETELGVNPSGTEATVAARLAALEADTGWRDVSALASGLTGTDITARVRRVGATVYYRLNYTQTAMANGVTILTSAGFLPTPPAVYAPGYSNGTGTIDGALEVNGVGLKLYSSSAANGAAFSVAAVYATSDAWPETLPGSAI